MTRITMDKRRIIVREETKDKFYDKVSSCENDLRVEIKKEISKTVPKWITDEMITSRYIKVSCSMDSLGIYNSQEPFEKVINKIGVDDSFPCDRHQHALNITKKVKSLADKVVKIRAQRNDFKTKLSYILNSFNTDKKLLEVLPELKKYFTEETKHYAVVPTEKIKEMQRLLKK